MYLGLGIVLFLIGFLGMRSAVRDESLSLEEAKKKLIQCALVAWVGLMNIILALLFYKYT